MTTFAFGLEKENGRALQQEPEVILVSKTAKFRLEIIHDQECGYYVIASALRGSFFSETTFVLNLAEANGVVAEYAAAEKAPSILPEEKSDDLDNLAAIICNLCVIRCMKDSGMLMLIRDRNNTCYMVSELYQDGATPYISEWMSLDDAYDIYEMRVGISR